LLSKGFAINADAFNAGDAFLKREGGRVKGLPIYINSTLRICKWVPSSLNLEGGDCDTIWPIAENDTTGQPDNVSQVPTYYADSVSSPPASLTDKPTVATLTPPSDSSAALLDSATSSSVLPVTFLLSTPTSPAVSTAQVSIRKASITSSLGRKRHSDYHNRSYNHHNDCSFSEDSE
jgi:hypothetical protein